jgi:hemolysin activation/secretion protein
LFVRIGGQITSGPLISNEQFVAGGVDTVRGYLEAEQSGDDACFGRMELRSPWFAKTTTFPAELMALAFLDGASLRLLDPLPSQKSYFNLSSGGVGLRVKYSPHLDATLDLAVPFEDATFTRAWDPRLLFSLAYQF